jgi:hypothetical protein
VGIGWMALEVAAIHADLTAGEGVEPHNFAKHFGRKQPTPVFKAHQKKRAFDISGKSRTLVGLGLPNPNGQPNHRW